MSRAYEIHEFISKLRRHAKGVAKEYQHNVDVSSQHGTIGDPVSDTVDVVSAPVYYAMGREQDKKSVRKKK